MDFQTFTQTLKELNLSREDFAKMVNMNTFSVSNWKNSKVPDWVAPLLHYYKKSKELENVIITLNKYR